MASPSTADNAQQHPSLDDVHRYVMKVAVEYDDLPQTPSGFIGPPCPTSRYLGEKTITAGPENKTAVPVMFRCEWGPSAQSRHALVWLKPSVEVKALALRLCQILYVPTSRTVVIEPIFKWMPGLSPYPLGMDKGKPTFSDLVQTVPCANEPLVLPFARSFAPSAPLEVA